MPVPEIICTTAEDFIQALQPIHPSWHKIGTSDAELMWLFRGQGHDGDDWELLPTAWRKNDFLPDKIDELDFEHKVEFILEKLSDIFDNIVGDGQKLSLISRLRDKANIKSTIRIVAQAAAEITLMNRYLRLADDVGHTIVPWRIPNEQPYGLGRLPFEGKYIYDSLIDITNLGIFAWWNQDCIALAQHHGLPTRLLDWTKNPLVAAFFAVENPRFDLTNSDKVAVYALSKLRAIPDNLGIVTVPSTVSRYIHAQQGVFTFDGAADNFYLSNGRWPTLLDSVENSKRLIVKVTLPKSEAAKAVDLLLMYRISKAHMMPTLDNVTHTLKRMLN